MGDPGEPSADDVDDDPGELRGTAEVDLAGGPGEGEIGVALVFRAWWGRVLAESEWRNRQTRQLEGLVPARA